MPRYYFHLHPDRLTDTEGQVLASDDEARREAQAVARDLARGRMVSTQEWIVVTDEHGAVVHEEPLEVN